MIISFLFCLLFMGIYSIYLIFLKKASRVVIERGKVNWENGKRIARKKIEFEEGLKAMLRNNMGGAPKSEKQLKDAAKVNVDNDVRRKIDFTQRKNRGGLEVLELAILLENKKVGGEC